jgi:hypothetical protein
MTNLGPAPVRILPEHPDRVGVHAMQEVRSAAGETDVSSSRCSWRLITIFRILPRSARHRLGAPLESAATRLGNRARSRRASARTGATHTCICQSQEVGHFHTQEALKQVFLTLSKRRTRLNQSIGTALTAFLQSFLQGSPSSHAGN